MTINTTKTEEQILQDSSRTIQTRRGDTEQFADAHRGSTAQADNQNV